MRRGLFEIVELVLQYQPELVQPDEYRKHVTDLVGRCIVAVDMVRRGVHPERDLAMLIYQREVPKTSLEKLLTRTQTALERYAERFVVKADPSTPPELWMSVLHMHTAGVQAYFSNQLYRSKERLSSTMSMATDPYMLPMAISAGMFLMIQQSRTAKYSKVMSTIRKTQEVVDSFVDSWEWFAVSAELVTITQRKYNFAAFHPRLVEIDHQLQQLLESGIKSISPQAQMIAATCAYVISQYMERPDSLVAWANVYKRASHTVRRQSPAYQKVLAHMYLRAYNLRHDHDHLVPLLQTMMADEAKSSGSSRNPMMAVYASWLATSLLALGRYKAALRLLREVDASALRAVNDNVRTSIIMQRSIAAAMSNDLSAPVDRRLLRLAVMKNESSQRRADDHAVRVSALLTMLLHCHQRDTVYSYTSDVVAEKLKKLHSNHAELRACAKLSALVRLVDIMEFGHGASVRSKRGLAQLTALLTVIDDASIHSPFELIPFHSLARALYGKVLRQHQAIQRTGS